MHVACLLKYEPAKSMLQEAASGEQMTALQKELEQLRTYAEQMKVDLEAAQQRQIDTQVPKCFVYELRYRQHLIFCAALLPALF